MTAAAMTALDTPSSTSRCRPRSTPSTSTTGRDRGCHGVYGAVASSGAAAGLLLGGVLTESLDWRWCLFVNVLIATGVLVAGRQALPDPPRYPSADLDVVSATLVTGGLATIVFGCGHAARHGWSSPAVIAMLVAGPGRHHRPHSRQVRSGRVLCRHPRAASAYPVRSIPRHPMRQRRHRGLRRLHADDDAPARRLHGRRGCVRRDLGTYPRSWPQLLGRPHAPETGGSNAENGGRGVYWEDPNGHSPGDHHPGRRSDVIEDGVVGGEHTGVG